MPTVSLLSGRVSIYRLFEAVAVHERIERSLSGGSGLIWLLGTYVVRTRLRHTPALLSGPINLLPVGMKSGERPLSSRLKRTRRARNKKIDVKMR